MSQLYVFPTTQENSKKDFEKELRMQKKFYSETQMHSALMDIGLTPAQREKLYLYGADGLGEQAEEVRRLLKGQNISSGSIDALFSAKNNTNSFGEDELILSPRPTSPSFSLSAFAGAVAEAMSALSRIRSKNEIMDAEATVNRLQASVAVMKEKIQDMKASAEVARNDAKITENAMKEMKRLQALMAIFGIFIAILMAILTAIVSIFTAGIGTAPMVAATTAAVAGGIGGVVTSSLALSDALRTDGKSWINDLAAQFVGKESPHNSAEKNAEIRKKTEFFKTSLSVLNAFFQAILAILSFGAAAAASITNTIANQTIKVMLRTINELIMKNLFKFLSSLASILANSTLTIFTGLMESGALARSLGGDRTANSLIESTIAKKEARIKQLKASQFYRDLVSEKGAAQADKEVEHLAEQEQKALLKGDIDTVVALRAKFMGLGSNLDSSLRKHLEEDARVSMQYTSYRAKSHYDHLIAEISQDHQKLMMGIMAAIGIFSMLASIASSAVNFDTPNSIGTVPPLPTKPNSLFKPFASEPFVKKMEAVDPKKFVRGAQGLQFIGSLAQTATRAGVSIKQSASESRVIEEQKNAKRQISRLQQELMRQEFEFFLTRLMAEGAFQIQEAHVESVKKIGQAFSDFWRTADQTFSVGIRTRV
ncbi:hypothetical protein [Candidatus Similichlamydia laticola]|uniref:Uncharacterized protein n=1 Tax=Candidatus Similichlamydia laticola TaxID=2170265 RepID=A0A369KGH4_9BACT|nr:hypothetical protein [Candidatus Similichlamydia laticola]RDB31805.1 hypothetical protein HAT2_00086 [Candidatus Similichlamydia laticola]